MTHDTLAARIEQQPLAAVVDYYAERLPKSARALAFLQRRRLAASSELRVGFADRTLGKQLPASRSKAGDRLRALLKDAGILKANGREALRGLVTVPLTDADGENVTGIHGLRIEASQGEKETTLGSGLFNAAALKRRQLRSNCPSSPRRCPRRSSPKRKWREFWRSPTPPRCWA